MSLKSHLNGHRLVEIIVKLLTCLLLIILTVPTSLRALDIPVTQGGDFQSALNSAIPGDRIILTAGATFTGNFILPYAGTGTQWITVQSSKLSALPAPGSRVSPSDAVNMPTVVAADPQYPAIKTVNNSNHYRFIGIEVKAPAGAYQNDVITLGTGYETQLSQLPHHFDVDRCYIHGDPQTGSKRGLALNGTFMSVRNSYFSDLKSTTQDSQAIMGWNGAGPFAIYNNYLEGSGENIMFGGATPAIQNLIPTGIDIRGNYFLKPLTWLPGSPIYAGTPWMVKTNLELKNAATVTIDGNIFENSWTSGQIGFGITFTPRAENGAAPWVRVQDITFTNNIVKNTAQGINIGGSDDLARNPDGTYQGVGQRMKIQNNVFSTNLSFYKLGRFFQIVNGAANVTFDHNTAFPTSHIGYFDGVPSPNLIYSNNLTSPTAYGMFGSYQGQGLTTLATYAPNSALNRNAMGQPSFLYPANNYFPQDLTSVGIANYVGGDFSLLATSPYAGLGTDGKNIGADIAAVSAATSTAINGQNSSYVTSPFDPTDSTTTLSILQGSNQTVSAGNMLPLRLMAKARPGDSVTFSAPVSGASGTFAGGAVVSVVADATGVAQAPVFTANKQPGTYNVVASVTGITGTLQFPEITVPGGVASVIAVSGSGQTAAVNTQFGFPLSVRVTDSFGNPVSNVAVTFTVPASAIGTKFVTGATLATTVTNSVGTAVSPYLVAGTTAGTSQVLASVSGFTPTTAFLLTTTVPAVPDLTISVMHAETFVAGQDASYSITVRNSGNQVTSGKVTVNALLPAGLTLVDSFGTGWKCTKSNCFRTDLLGAGASFLPLTVKVAVAANAPSDLTFSAVVSGGGETNIVNNSASDSTTISCSATSTTCSVVVPVISWSSLLDAKVGAAAARKQIRR